MTHGFYSGHSAAGPVRNHVRGAYIQTERSRLCVTTRANATSLRDRSIAKHIPALLLAGGKDTNAGVDDAETLWVEWAVTLAP